MFNIIPSYTEALAIDNSGIIISAYSIAKLVGILANGITPVAINFLNFPPNPSPEP
jgi:hypothetical protein